MAAKMLSDTKKSGLRDDFELIIGHQAVFGWLFHVRSFKSE